MDSKVISHVFGAVHSVERTLQRVETLLEEQPSQSTLSKEQQHVFQTLLPQQKDIIKRMRRIANLLQLEAAKENWSATVRSLRVFYGLHQMVRKDLIQAQKTLQQHQVRRNLVEEHTAELPENSLSPILH